AWVTGKVEELENPEVLLDQARREMQETLARNRERAIQAITQKNMLQAEVEKLERTVRDLERKAELALQQGKRDLALQIIREKKAQEGALETMRASLQQAIETVESIKTAVRRQEEEVRVKTAQALAMKARWKQAQIQTAINKALEGISLESIESSWSAAEQRIQKAEAEAKARQEMAAQSLQGRIAALQDAQIDYEAEAELQKIEQRLGMRPASATDSVASSTPTSVDDSEALKELEELERKLQAAQGDSSTQRNA
ncbi:MAG: PspA/IM30 family protein, partial [Fimbriimonadales bacterium]|nr:PspA/IM30 family protein [Fimbriimonadales bacterium]